MSQLSAAKQQLLDPAQMSQQSLSQLSRLLPQEVRHELWKRLQANDQRHPPFVRRSLLWGFCQDSFLVQVAEALAQSYGIDVR